MIPTEPMPATWRDSTALNRSLLHTCNRSPIGCLFCGVFGVLGGRRFADRAPSANTGGLFEFRESDIWENKHTRPLLVLFVFFLVLKCLFRNAGLFLWLIR